MFARGACSSHGACLVATIVTESLNEAQSAWLGRVATRYLGQDAPLPQLVSVALQGLACEFERVEMPNWAADLGVGEPRALLVPRECVVDGPGPTFERCDWWRALFFFVSGEAERAIEQAQGCVHSYAARLPHAIHPIFEAAWANRILLFVRRLAARELGQNEIDVFGPKPKATVHLTHDVDAVAKTIPIRLKKMAFEGYNAARSALDGELRASARRLVDSARFAVRPADYWQFETLSELESRHGVSSTFHFYAGSRRSPRQMLFDPSYDVASSRFAQLLQSLAHQGHRVGLHQSFDSWCNPGAMAREKSKLEEAVGASVAHCRQHWLRFSWEKTWAAQERAGFSVDATLGFNDRPGFRTGCAMTAPAWLGDRASETLHTMPLVLMDSHLFDYNPMEKDARAAHIDKWLDEVHAVGGEASVVWHQRVFEPQDYGWGGDYEYVLQKVASW